MRETARTSDGERDRAEGADGRRHHHEADHLERICETVWMPATSGLPGPERQQCEGEKDREEKNRKHVAGTKPTALEGTMSSRNWPKPLAWPYLRRWSRSCPERRGIDMHARARRPYIDEQQRKHERRRSHEFEIDERFDGDTPLVAPGHACDAMHTVQRRWVRPACAELMNSRQGLHRVGAFGPGIAPHQKHRNAARETIIDRAVQAVCRANVAVGYAWPEAPTR